MSDESTLQRIKQFGYTALQFGFIRLVALHSGVFLRRQYLQFAGISSGKHATSFLGRLIENGHCRTVPLAGKISVYHPPLLSRGEAKYLFLLTLTKVGWRPPTHVHFAEFRDQGCFREINEL